MRISHKTKSALYCFYMKVNVLEDFHICIKCTFREKFTLTWIKHLFKKILALCQTFNEKYFHEDFRWTIFHKCKVNLKMKKCSHILINVLSTALLNFTYRYNRWYNNILLKINKKTQIFFGIVFFYLTHALS